MPRWLQVTLHAGLVGCNIALAMHGVPPGVTFWLAVLQGVVGAVAQEFNTDGTPQETPFAKSK
jgi:hypothetical protein